MSEIDKLAAMLTERGISFEQRPIIDGEQILVPGEWDAICNRYSYGGPEGLLEVMGDPVTLPGEGAVAGWLTAEDVIRRLEANAGPLPYGSDYTGAGGVTPWRRNTAISTGGREKPPV